MTTSPSTPGTIAHPSRRLPTRPSSSASRRRAGTSSSENLSSENFGGATVTGERHDASGHTDRRGYATSVRFGGATRETHEVRPKGLFIPRLPHETRSVSPKPTGGSEVKYPHVQDKRPMSPEEARRGMEAVRKWPEKDRNELLILPRNEAMVMLMLAGALGAVPFDSSQ